MKLNRRGAGGASAGMEDNLRPCTWLFDDNPFTSIVIRVMRGLGVDKLSGKGLPLRVDNDSNAIPISHRKLPGKAQFRRDFLRRTANLTARVEDRVIGSGHRGDNPYDREDYHELRQCLTFLLHILLCISALFSSLSLCQDSCHSSLDHSQIVRLPNNCWMKIPKPLNRWNQNKNDLG